MPPLPKKKHSKKRQGGRTSHFGIKGVPTSECPQCHNAKMPHRVCPTCGYYNGRVVVSKEE